MNQTELQAAIVKHGLADYRDAICQASQPCLCVRTALATDPIPSHVSKIGGNPDLPPDVEWPVTSVYSGQDPMLFLVRIVGSDLRRIHPDLAVIDLLFFAEWDVNPEGIVLAIPSDVAKEPRVCPDRRDDISCQSINECRVMIDEAVSLPSASSAYENWRYPESLRTYGLTPEVIAARKRFDYRPIPLEALESEHWPSSRELPMAHRVFGYPLFAQGHPAMEAEQRFTPYPVSDASKKGEFIQKASQWRSLISIGTDDMAGITFGDTGVCGFLITEDTLRRQAFNEAFFYQNSY